ncbi:MAG: SCO family protein [Candidatus Thiodiazotropha sp. LLP2]
MQKFIRYILAIFLISASNFCIAKEIGGDFTLTADDGSEYSLHDSRDKIVILTFGYTFCPDICPTALSNVGYALDGLGDEIDQVEAFFVSLDPDRDTPDHLAEYTHYFHPHITGLTGSTEMLRRIADQYRVKYSFVNKGKKKHYTMDHSANFYIIDTKGNLLRILPHGLPPQALLKSLRSAIPTKTLSYSM